MGALLKIFSNHQNDFIAEKKENFIFYKIVDAIEDNERLILQCINTSSIFNIKISEIVFDIDILFGLHPIQACYVGMEYPNSKNYMTTSTKHQKIYENTIKKYSACRYGRYSILAQDRKGNIIFSDVISREEFTMAPQEIAFCEEFISEFDAQQAFQIGISVGLKSVCMKRSNHKPLKSERPYLQLIK